MASVSFPGVLPGSIPSPTSGRTLFANASDNGRLYVKKPDGTFELLDASTSFTGGCGPCGGGGGATCSDVANCIGSDAGTQAALNLYIQGAFNYATVEFVATAPTLPFDSGLVRVNTTNADIYTSDGTNIYTNFGTGAGGGVISNAPNAPATDRKVPVYDGPSGQAIVDSIVSIDASGNVLGVNDITIGGVATFNGNLVLNGSNIAHNNTTQTGTTTLDGLVTTHNNSINTGTENFDAGYIGTYQDSTINHNGTTINNSGVSENYTDTPNQISCEVAPVFGAALTAPALTQYAEVQIQYNNSVDPIVQRNVRTLLDGNTQVIQFITPTNSGEVTLSWAAGQLTIAITGGTAGFFSFVGGTGVCYYNGVSVNTYQNKIHSYDGDIFEFSNTYQSNEGVTEVYDSASQTTHNGDAYFENAEVNNLAVTNINIDGQDIPKQRKASATIVSGTSVIAVEADATNASVVVFNTQTAPVGAISYDTTTPGQITFNSTATETSLVIDYVIFY